MKVDIPDLELLADCHECRGNGWNYGYVAKKSDYLQIACTVCSGKGKFITDAGERLKEFLKFIGVNVP